MASPFVVFILAIFFVLLVALTILLFAINTPTWLIWTELSITTIYFLGVATYFIVNKFLSQRTPEDKTDWILETRNYISKWYKEEMGFGEDIDMKYAKSFEHFVGVPYVIWAVPRRVGQRMLGLIVRCKPLKVTVFEYISSTSDLVGLWNKYYPHHPVTPNELVSNKDTIYTMKAHPPREKEIIRETKTEWDELKGKQKEEKEE